MAENENTTEATVTIDGTTYALADLNDAAKTQISNLRYVEKEIEESKNHLALLQAARQFYAGQLSKELPAK